MLRKHPRRPEDAWGRWSYSKLSAAAACPLRCFLEFILEESVAQNPISVFGQAMHYMFKLFFTPHKKTGRYPYGELSAFKGVWKGFWWSAVNSRHGFGGRREPPQNIAWEYKNEPGVLFAKGLKIIENFYDHFEVVRRDGIIRLPERRFIFFWHGLKISGLLDLLSIYRDGAIITDYKIGRYKEHLIETGPQITIYQLAYEMYFRERITDRPPLKAIQIFDYLSGNIQNAPIRAPHEFGILLDYLVEASEYYRAILTGQPLRQEIVPQLHHFNPEDMANSDISPRLPRGEHCTYCRHFTQCREWELGQRPPARIAFQEKHNLEIVSSFPSRLTLPFEKSVFFTEGKKSLSNQVPGNTQISIFIDKKQ